MSTARVAPASQNTPSSLTKPNWSETSSSRCTRNCRSRPCTLASQFSRSALPSKTQNDWLSARAAAPEHRPADPAQVASAARTIGFAVGWHERPARLTVLVPARLWPRLANRQLRQHTLCVRSLVPRSLLYSFIAPTLLTREPLRCGNKDTHNVALSALPLRRCHSDCFPDSPSGTMPPASWQSPRQLAGIVPANPPLRLKMITGSARPVRCKAISRG